MKIPPLPPPECSNRVGISGAVPARGVVFLGDGGDLLQTYGISMGFYVDSQGLKQRLLGDVFMGIVSGCFWCHQTWLPGNSPIL
jgi:hypothetical protein